LEKIKVEKTVKVDVSRSKIPLIYSSLNINEPSVPIVDWLSIPSISPFSLGLLANFGIPDIVETPPDTRSGF